MCSETTKILPEAGLPLVWLHSAGDSIFIANSNSNYICMHFCATNLNLGDPVTSHPIITPASLPTAISQSISKKCMTEANYAGTGNCFESRMG
jgi:hypothetical protein